MKKGVASPKQTSGAGYSFEDKVVALHLLYMLIGESPLPALPGQLSRVDCQGRVDGWQLDDLVLSFRGKTDFKVAFSIKSNSQFSETSAPTDFVEAAWIDFHNGELFSPTSDYLGFVVAPQAEPQRKAIHSLLKKARFQSPTQLASRINTARYASASERGIYASFACPSFLPQKDTGELLRRLVVLDFDFENPNSKDEAQVVALCSFSLADGSADSAQALWGNLCDLAMGISHAGGGVLREELVSIVGEKHELRDFPDYTKDWSRLTAWSDTKLQLVSDKVGDKVSLVRAEVEEEIHQALRESCLACVLGASGTGKTALARKIVESSESRTVLWLDAGALVEGFWDSFDSARGLEHPFAEVLGMRSHARGLVVIDGLERLSSEGDFNEANLLLKMLCVEEGHTPWSVVITCRAEEWERIQLGFSKQYKWKSIQLLSPTSKKLAPVWKKYPALYRLAMRPELGPILRNLKILDTIATAINVGMNPPDRAVGESDVIDWWWKHLVRRPVGSAAMRARVLKRLAAYEGDTGLFARPESDFDSDELGVMPGLSDYLVLNSGKESVAFAHDLFADWARSVVIQSQDDVREYLSSRVVKPHWFKAIRLWAQSLLEQDSSTELWRKEFAGFPQARGLLLESLFLAINSGPLLEKVKELLFEGEGLLLQEMLSRFLHLATTPNADLVAISKAGGLSGSYARILSRIPVWIHWLDMLKFVYDNQEEIVEKAPLELALVVKTWLKYTPSGTVLRVEAAEVALKLGWGAYRSNGWKREEKVNKESYLAALAAYEEKPEEVKTLALKACGRIPPEKDDGEKFSLYSPPGTKVSYGNPIFPDSVVQEPWPCGPYSRTDSQFRCVCIEESGLELIMTANPELASEILLGLFIKECPRKEAYGSHDRAMIGYDMELSDDLSYDPRFYTTTPHIAFLRSSPLVALDSIIRLVDFATERWMEFHHGDEGQSMGVGVPLESPKLFVGDYRVFHFYHGIGESNIVTSTLMALEKWLYLLIDEEVDVAEYIQLILNRANSLAFVGLLLEVGKYSLGLFEKELQPLLLASEIYWFEQTYTASSGALMGTPMTLGTTESFWNMAREWDSMEHRKYSIQRIAQALFIKDESFQVLIGLASKGWPISREDNKEQWYIDALRSSFDISNWKNIELDDGTTGLQFVPPEGVGIPDEEVERSQQSYELLITPFICRKILNGEESCSFDDIPKLLGLAKRVYNSLGGEGDDLPSKREEVVCAVIAVVAHKFSSWFESNLEDRAWCLEALCYITENPPPPDLYMVAQTVSDGWENFGAIAAVAFWKEDKDHPILRRLVASYIPRKIYNVAASLMETAFEYREELEDDFWRLVCLMLSWASIRYGLEHKDRMRGQAAPWLKGWAYRKRATAWSLGPHRSFVMGTSPTECGGWGQAALKAGSLRHHDTGERGRNDMVTLCRVPAIDSFVLNNAFGQLFLPSQAKDEGEKRRFMAYWQQALQLVLTWATYYDENGIVYNPQPEAGIFTYKFGRAAFDSIAIVVGQVADREQARQLWEPILSLGPRCKHFIEAFMSSWFVHAKKATDRAVFVQRWREMVEYALNEEGWDSPEYEQYYNATQCLMCVLGLSRYATSWFSEEDADLVATVVEYHERLAGRFFHDSSRVEGYLYWLCKENAKNVRLAVLGKLYDEVKVADKYWWQLGSGIARIVGQYLDTVWTEHREDLKRNEELMKTFQSLLHVNIAQKDSLSLDIATRVASGLK